MQIAQKHFTTIVYAKFWGQTELIMANWKNRGYCVHYLSIVARNTSSFVNWGIGKGIRQSR